MNTEKKITVTLVDDSSVIRHALTRILQTDPNIEIIASVANGESAIISVKRKKPDVLLLDIEMPVMDGITALPHILKNSPETKVIMCSGLTAEGADITIKAMSLGAVECVVKPSSAQDTGIGSDFHQNLLRLVNVLGSKRNEHEEEQYASKKSNVKNATANDVLPQYIPTLKNDIHVYMGKPQIIAIGSSTGGPQALFNVLKSIGSVDVPIVITQHMPATFTKMLAEHITQHSGQPACEGEDGMILEAGKIYVAPGGKHMIFTQDNGQISIELDDGEPENFCKPSVDPMLRSLLDIYQEKILCVILTGMGHDGLSSARALSEKNGRIIAQDQKTSVVWGMPGAVARDEICNKVLPLDEIGPFIKTILK